MVSLLISKDTIGLVEGIETLVAFNLSLRYIISFVSNVLYSNFPFKQCRKANGIGNRTLVLPLSVMTPPIIPVTELDLGLSFFPPFSYQTVFKS